MNEALFVVDAGACTGCQACAVACLDRADLGDRAWLLRVERREGGVFPNVQLSFGIRHCWHCENPPCLPVCPVRAITRRDDGLIAIDRDLCTGCGLCIPACPYEAILALADGRVAKCDGCPEQLAAAAMPVCVRACPMRALGWGDASVFDERPRVRQAVPAEEMTHPRLLWLQRLPDGEGETA